MSAAGVLVLALVLCCGLALLVTAARAPAEIPRLAPGDGDDGDTGGGGGSQPRVPPAPTDPSGIDESPGWWPAFEREFAAYVRRRAEDRVTAG